ncbi:MAG: NPCBM/NEW2 domain-containing protein [Pirellulales bacterium]|nr:NPCBM/NEW2 domain-containing protein [Pirellulales bacterium]
MSRRLSDNADSIRREVYRLGDALLSGAITAEETERLNEMVAEDTEARRYYVRFMYDSAALSEWGRDAYGGDFVERPRDSATERPSDPSPLPPLPSPLSASFIGGPVFSYMVASVVVCLMLLGAWAYKINYDRNIFIADSRNLTTSGPSDQSELVFVGRVTGMKDCRWADPESPTIVGASVPLDRSYSLSSGLMEIAYNSGAKVILEGPCSYKVESSAGGFLMKGKLTANIKTQSSKPKAQSLDSPPLSTLYSPLFSIRTPTAIVTDLGTEFGVEVNENGDTTSHVFQGSVKVEILPSPASGRGAGGEGGMVQLAAGESALVKKTAAETVRFTRPATPPTFVRRIYEPPKLIDLLDIVAGGDGTGRRRERGIDPTTGKQDTYFLPTQYRFENRYHLVQWNRLIDGVCIPDGRTEPVVLDSAGHTFAEFGELTEGLTIGPIWAREADVSTINQKRTRHAYIYTMGRGDEFMPEDRGLLGFHTNKGITFDLRAMREAHKGIRPSIFKAVIGLADASVAYADRFGKADVWIFVDGRLAWKHRVHQGEKPVAAEVELGPDAQFLTILGTNAGDGSSGDWLVLGDPVLELAETEAAVSTDNGKQDAEKTNHTKAEH